MIKNYIKNGIMRRTFGYLMEDISNNNMILNDVIKKCFIKKYTSIDILNEFNKI